MPGAWSGRASGLGYAGVVAFYLLYFFRPEDFIPGLAMIPVEKLAGGIAALALLGAILGGRFRNSREVTLMCVILADFCLAIPTSIWQGGSFALIVNGFAKYIVIAVATICMADSAIRYRRLMFVHTLAFLFLAAMALGDGGETRRMYGVGSMFSDPNDFALYLCIIVPLCVAFCLTARTRLRRLFWVGGACLSIAAIFATYSRGGFLALVATLLMLAWRFRGGVRRIIVLAILGGVIAATAFSGSSYMHRLDTILHPDTDKTDSAQARQALLIRSIEVTLNHPLLGVGPGSFQIISGNWHVTHNTYTQLTSEAGIPSLCLFLALMWFGFRNLSLARAPGREGEVAVLAGALQCSLAGYLVGAFFLSTAYWIEPYLLIAFTVVLSRLAAESPAPAPVAASAAGQAGLAGFGSAAGRPA